MTNKLVLAAVALFTVFGSAGIAQAQSREAERIAADIYGGRGSIYDRGAYDDDQFWSREIHRRYGVDEVVLVERRESGFTWLNILDDILQAALFDNHRHYRPYPVWVYDRSWYHPRVVIDHRYDNRRYDDRRWDDRRYDNRRYDDHRWDNRRFDDHSDDHRYDNRRDDHRFDNRGDNRRFDDHRDDHRTDNNRRNDNWRSGSSHEDRGGNNHQENRGNSGRDNGNRGDHGRDYRRSG